MTVGILKMAKWGFGLISVLLLVTLWIGSWIMVGSGGPDDGPYFGLVVLLAAVTIGVPLAGFLSLAVGRAAPPFLSFGLAAVVILWSVVLLARLLGGRHGMPSLETATAAILTFPILFGLAAGVGRKLERSKQPTAV
jgi:peptidoglycan/LPS O-acetylase OafA/YrhL